MYGSWSTALVLRDHLIVSWPKSVVAFDQASGKVVWTCESLGDLVYPSPVRANGIVVAMGGFGGPSLAVRVGGSGDVTGTHRLWR